MFGIQNCHRASALAAFVLTVLCGCAEFRLPAIDPSGQRIFLPTPNYTTLNQTNDPTTGRPTQPLLDHFRRGVQRESQPAFASPPDPRCELPPLAPNQLGQSADICPPPAADPVAPRVVVPGVCQDTTTASEDANRGCLGRERLPSDPVARVTLSQRQQVAMVGTEVVLVGGVCDGEGYYRMREPLEWAIAQGSVGHFVEPGQPSVGRLGLRGRFASFMQEPLPQLLSNNYAYGCTSKKAQVITKGTITTSDDVVVHKGQGWISVTSPIEGSSYVTLMAPDLDGWEQRKETAVIHWIDGQWTLPPSATVRGIEPHTLTTTVRRRVTSGPLSGWIVRYQILDPTATFDDNTTTREVITDSQGQASIQVVPVSPDGGLARVNVQVIRPARGGVPDRLVVGQGTASINWTTSNLTLQLSGPEVTELNEVVEYRIDVTNPGTVAATDVVIQSLIPSGLEYVTSSLPAQATGSRLDWTLASIGPGETRRIDVSYRAIQGGSARHCVSAQAAGVTPVEDCLTTLVNAESLYIEMLGWDPNEPVNVGQELNYQIRVYNRGNVDLPNVTLTDRFDPGLTHPAGQSPVEWDIGPVAAGQMREVDLRFVVNAAGRQCHTLEASAPSVPSAQTSACVTAVERQDLSQLEVRKTASRAEVMVDEDIDFFVMIENVGDAPLTNLTILDAYDPELEPRQAEPRESEYGRDGVVWYVSQLDPGEKRTFQVRCRGVYDVRAACSRVIVKNADGIERTDEVCIPVLPAANSPADPNDNGTGSEFDVEVPSARSGSNDARPLPNATTPGNPSGANAAGPNDRSTESGSIDSFSNNTAGSLKLSLDARGDRWRIGDEVQYLIVIENDRTVADADVVLSIELPRQVKMKEYSGPVAAGENSADWRTLRMVPIRTLRAGEKIAFQIVAEVVGEGELIARAVVASVRTPEGVAREDISLASP